MSCSDFADPVSEQGRLRNVKEIGWLPKENGIGSSPLRTAGVTYASSQ